MMLPAPGPFPARKPQGPVIVIFIVILVVVAGLLARGYSLETAFEAVGGAGVLAAAIAARLAAVPADGGDGPSAGKRDQGHGAA